MQSWKPRTVSSLVLFKSSVWHSLSLSLTHTHTLTHPHTHIYTHTHAHTHTLSLFSLSLSCLYLSFPLSIFLPGPPSLSLSLWTNENHCAWTTESGVDRRKFERSHFRGAKSFASPPQLIWTGWRSCSLSKGVSCFPLRSVHVKRACTHACYPPCTASQSPPPPPPPQQDLNRECTLTTCEPWT